MAQTNHKHTFSFYQKDLTILIESPQLGTEINFKDAELWNRLVKVVRIKPQDLFILFDKHINITIQATTKLLEQPRHISGIIKKKETNIPLYPHITLYLPLLKKEALEYVVYVAAATGVTTIVPLITEKSQQQTPTEKKIARLEKIMIAACEQSKNFVPPELQKTIKITQFPDIVEKNTTKICFDEQGAHATDLIKTISQDAAIEVTLGPEGGFTEYEKKILQTAGFTCYKLTNTILRSQEAACIGLGIVRSLRL